MKGTELSAIAQGIAHKVNAPGVRKALWLLQWLFYPGWQPLLCLAPQGQAHLLINAVQPFVVDLLTTVTQPVIAFPEAFYRMADGQVL